MFQEPFSFQSKYFGQRLLLLLVVCEAILVFFDLSVFHFAFPEEIADLFNITYESNIPTFFASSQAIFAGVFCLLISFYIKKENKTWRSIGWLLTGLFFLFIAMDDASKLHERLASALSDSIKESNNTSVIKETVESFSSYYWQLLILPFFVSGGLFMAGFMLKEFKSFKRYWMFLLGCAFMGMAVFLDYFDAIEEVYGPIMQFSSLSFDFIQHLFRLTEESGEMFATSCFAISFISYFRLLRFDLQDYYGKLTISIAVFMTIIMASACLLLVIGRFEIQGKKDYYTKVINSKVHLKKINTAELKIENLEIDLSKEQANTITTQLDFPLNFSSGELVLASVTSKKHQKINSLAILLYRNHIAGIDIIYQKPHIEYYKQFEKALGTPYRSDENTDHWETSKFKIKAFKDGSQLYIVDKRFRNELVW